MILFYQMAKISLRIAKELDIVDNDMEEYILCRKNPKKSCQHAKNLEEKLESFLDRIRKFLEMPTEGFLKKVRNWTWWIWGNDGNDENRQPFHEILTELDGGFDFQTFKTGKGGEGKGYEGAESSILKLKGNDREKKNKELEKSVNVIYENKGNMKGGES